MVQISYLGVATLILAGVILGMLIIFTQDAHNSVKGLRQKGSYGKYKLGEWIVGPKGSWYQIDDINDNSYCLLNTKGKREINSIKLVDASSFKLSVWDILNKIPSEILQNLKFE